MQWNRLVVNLWSKLSLFCSMKEGVSYLFLSATTYLLFCHVEQQTEVVVAHGRTADKWLQTEVVVAHGRTADKWLLSISICNHLSAVLPCATTTSVCCSTCVLQAV